MKTFYKGVEVVVIGNLELAKLIEVIDKRSISERERLNSGLPFYVLESQLQKDNGSTNGKRQK